MNLLVKKKQIPNIEFETAYQNIDNKKIINSFYKKYRKRLSVDEIKSCGLIALWKCLQCHDSSKQKFTTSLYRFMTWECLQELKKKYKTFNTCSLSGFVHYDHSNIDLDDLFQSLNQTDKNILDMLIDNQSITFIQKSLSISETDLQKSIKSIKDRLSNLVYS